MASRTSGKGPQGAAGAPRKRAGQSAGAARAAGKAPAKKAPAKKAPAKKAPARKSAAKAPPPKAPNPTSGVYRAVRAVWMGLARAVAGALRGIGRGARGLDPAHRKDGLALLFLALALVVAGGTWSHLDGPVGDLVETLVTGTFGRLDLVVPLLLGAIAVRLIFHPEQPEANGRIVIGLSALVIGVLGLIHVACGAPGRGQGSQAIQDAGGLIGWAVSRPLIFAMGTLLAFPILLLLTVFGLLVVTATPVAAVPQRLRQLGARLGLVRPYDPAYEAGTEAAEDGEDASAYADYAGEWRETPARRPRRASPGRGDPAGPADPQRAEEEALRARRRPRRAPSVQPPLDRPLDAVDVAAAAAAALDGAVRHGVQPSPLVADLSSGIS
ncbi:cell division protein FtsK, partial [Streptomyces sp. B1866]|nr:cell division protein FtsK [Streptomyces sp. B1866]